MGCVCTKLLPGISISEMRDGEIGCVLCWHDDNCPVGTIIQRYKNALIILGHHSGLCFDLILDCQPDTTDRCRVRLLVPEDTITIASIKTLCPIKPLCSERKNDRE